MFLFAKGQLIKINIQSSCILVQSSSDCRIAALIPSGHVRPSLSQIRILKIVPCIINGNRILRTQLYECMKEKEKCQFVF